MTINVSNCNEYIEVVIAGLQPQTLYTQFSFIYLDVFSPSLSLTRSPSKTMRSGSFAQSQDQRQWEQTETQYVPSEHQETHSTVRVTGH